jgi:hypothetical protein
MHIFQLGSFGKKHPFMEGPVPTNVPLPLVGAPLPAPNLYHVSRGPSGRGVRSASSSQNPFQTTGGSISPPPRPVQHNYRVSIPTNIRGSTLPTLNVPSMLFTYRSGSVIVPPSAEEPLIPTRRRKADRSWAINLRKPSTNSRRRSRPNPIN